MNGFVHKVISINVSLCLQYDTQENQQNSVKAEGK